MNKLISRKNIMVCISVALIACLIGFICWCVAAISTDSNGQIFGNSGDTVAIKSGILNELSMEELIEESALIIYGTVTGNSDPFEIMSVSNGSSIFTDYYIQPSIVFRGDASISDPITVRMEGGKIGNVEVIAEEDAELNVGDSYILFLYKPGMGGGFNTEGDYYYIKGCHQGVFESDADFLFDVNTIAGDADELDIEEIIQENEDLLFASESEELFELAEFVGEVQESNIESPIDETLEVNTFMDNLKKNLETGFITQEEYDMYLAETSQYAKIIK